MWIDTHCHLDASEFAGKGYALADEAVHFGVSGMIIPAVHVKNFNVSDATGTAASCLFLCPGNSPLVCSYGKRRRFTNFT